jgi:SsrA-binding protein
MPEKKPSDDILVATHHHALRDYHILDTMEAGIVLVGTEIKSIRNRRGVSLEDSFARIDGDEVFLYNMHVNPYEQGGRFNVEPTRVRKLLLHKQQIKRLTGLLSQRGTTLVPIRLYLTHGLAKIALAVGKGKRVYEKRDTIREREIDRELRRTFKEFRRRGDRTGS